MVCNSGKTQREEMSKFFVDKEYVGESEILIKNLTDINHISKVLRLGIGDMLIISDSSDFDYQVEIIKIMSTEITCKILDKQKFAKEPSTKVTLFQGIPKQGKMELIVQKNVEIGIMKIVPVFMDRTVVVDKGNFSKKIERWNKISQEASGQCRRGIIPVVTDPVNFDSMIKYLDEFDQVVFPYENQESFTVKNLMKNLKQKPSNIALIIGPEGGFSEREAKILSDIGVLSVNLGKTILRTETAGFVALSMIMYEFELD